MIPAVNGPRQIVYKLNFRDYKSLAGEYCGIKNVGIKRWLLLLSSFIEELVAGAQYECKQSFLRT